MKTLCLPKYTAFLVAEEIPNTWTGCVGTDTYGKHCSQIAEQAVAAYNESKVLGALTVSGSKAS